MTPAEMIEAFRTALDAEEKLALDATFEETHPHGNHWAWGEVADLPAPVVRGGYLRSNGGLSYTVSLVTLERYPDSESSHTWPAPVLLNADRVHEGPGRHIVRHDPAAVLADIAAKRAILNAFAEVSEHYQPDPADWHEVADGRTAALYDCVKSLAAAYGIGVDGQQQR